MSNIPLNKFEKEKKVIEWHLAGKTYREISKLHISFRDIKKIITAYEKKIRLQQSKKGEENKIKKLSLSSQAFKLFSDGKTPVQVAIDLDLNFERVRKHWTGFLRLKNMKKLYNIYIENEFHLDYLFKIYYFMKRNKISIRDVSSVLNIINNVIHLNHYYSNLKTEIEKMEQTKNNYLLNQNTNYHQPLLPLGLPKYYYEQL